MASGEGVGIKRSLGGTESERRLHTFCESSFLKLWTYSNLFRDQRSGPRGAGKELCDLLVVFGDDVIIFSDKHCSFLRSGDASVDWARWRKRAITKSVEQVLGAERWLRSFPDRIFLDPSCQRRFPFQLPSTGKMRVHRVVVAAGAAEACRSSLPGAGSLWFVQGPSGQPAHQALPTGREFVLEMNDLERFVHVFDEVSLPLVFGLFDTAADFISYLNEKENLVRSGRIALVSGEENLATMILLNRYFGGLDRILEESRAALVVPPDLCTRLNEDPQYEMLRRFTQPSYFWDRLIDLVGETVLAGSAVSIGDDRGFVGHEERLRALAAPPRAERAALGHAFLEFASVADNERLMVRTARIPATGDRGYVFLLLPYRGIHPAEGTSDSVYEEYREERRELLTAYAMVYKWRRPDLNHVIAVATEPPSQAKNSVEVLHIDGRLWTSESDQVAAQFHAELGILESLDQQEVVLTPGLTRTPSEEP